jgi:hypothetical protein
MKTSIDQVRIKLHGPDSIEVCEEETIPDYFDPITVIRTGLTKRIFELGEDFAIVKLGQTGNIIDIKGDGVDPNHPDIISGVQNLRNSAQLEIDGGHTIVFEKISPTDLMTVVKDGTRVRFRGFVPSVEEMERIIEEIEHQKPSDT